MDSTQTNPFDSHIANPRINGFSYPPDARQIAVGVYITFSSAVVFTLCINVVDQGAPRVYLVAVFTALLLSMLGNGFALSCSNPVDPHVSAVWKSGVEGKLDEPPTDDRVSKFCWVCKAHVETDSLHCRYCDKCIPRLDHHCFYVNNCIGRRNYGLYISSLISIFLYSSAQAATSVISFVAAAQNPSKVGAFNLSLPAFQSIVLIPGILSFAFSIFIADLLRLHILLYFKGMTTLEYSHYLDERTGSKTMSIGQVLFPKKRKAKAIVPDTADMEQEGI
ncbi:hypothetical protein HDU77_003875 [Chytriomyces hyalinus]|nr:hypothetical protein HDU77_003875 [Chytriomyces hyalinus]